MSRPRNVKLPEDDFVESAHHVEERGLAGAVRTDQADDGTLRYVEVYGTDRDEAAECLGDPTRPQYVGVTGVYFRASAFLSHGSNHSSRRGLGFVHLLGPLPVGDYPLRPQQHHDDEQDAEQEKVVLGDVRVAEGRAPDRLA